MCTLRWRLPCVKCNPYDLSGRLGLSRFVYKTEFLWSSCNVLNSQYSSPMLPGPPTLYEAAYPGATVLSAHQKSDC